MFNKNRNCSIYVPLRLFFFRRESGLRRTEHERLRKQAFLCIIFLCLPAPMILSPPFFIERLPHFRRYTIDPANASTRREHLRPVLKTANSRTFSIAKITGSETLSISKTTGSATLSVSKSPVPKHFQLQKLPVPKHFQSQKLPVPRHFQSQNHRFRNIFDLHRTEIDV